MGRKIKETISPDKRWKAWIRVSGFTNLEYTFVIKDNNRSLFSLGRNKLPRKRTERLPIGTNYYEPSSQFQKPDLPIGQEVTIKGIRFTPTHARVEFNRKFSYAHQPPQEILDYEEFSLV